MTGHLHALTGPDGPSQQAASAGPNAVKTRLTSKRARRLVENDDYAAFARRILRAYARRVADGDAEALIAMTGLAQEIDAAIGQAVTGLRAAPTTRPLLVWTSAARNASSPQTAAARTRSSSAVVPT